MSLKQLLVLPVEKDMLKNEVKYFEIPNYGAPFTTYGYQLQIYGCSRMEPNMSMAFCCNISLNQLLVWQVDKDMLKNGVENLEIPIYEAPFTPYWYQLQIMVVGEWNLIFQ